MTTPFTKTERLSRRRTTIQRRRGCMTERTLPKGARLIPSEAERVFAGEIYDVYQWPQAMPDGSVQTFEMLKRPDTVMVIALDEAGQAVVIDEWQPGGIVRKNHLPVGRVDAADESTLAAAQRELSEETGWQYDDWQLLDVAQIEKKMEWFVHLFVAKQALRRVAQQLDAGESIRVRTAPLTEVLHQENVLRYFPWLREVTTVDDLVPRPWCAMD